MTLWLWPEKDLLPGQAYSMQSDMLGPGSALAFSPLQNRLSLTNLQHLVLYFFFFFNHTGCDKWIYAAACLWKIGTICWINAVQQGTSPWVWETDQMKRYIYSEMKLSKISQATDVAINRLTSCITRNFREVCFTVLRSSTALSENTDRGR